MSEILIVYTTLRGNTGKMVDPVATGVRSEGVDARVMPVDEVTMADMVGAGGIVVGSPVRFGGIDWQPTQSTDCAALD